MATPFAMVPVPRADVPLLKVTIPVAAVGTVAVSVKFIAVPTVVDDDASMMVLVAFATVRAAPALTLGLYPLGLDV